jgi:hypothetical protein
MRLKNFSALCALAVCVCVAIGSGGNAPGAQAAARPAATGVAITPPDLTAALSVLSITDRQDNTALAPVVQAVAGALARRVEPNLALALDGPHAGVRLNALGGLLDSADLEAVMIPFGVAGRDGRLTTGVTAATAPGGLIYAPVAGKIGFAGPLDGYGAVVIVMTGPDTAVVLTGLAQAIAKTGDRVQVGSPLGRMQRTGLTDAALPPPELYVEVKDQGRFVDPLLWFAARS